MRALGKGLLAMACLCGAATPAVAQSSFSAHTALQWPGVLTGAFLGFLLLPVAYNIAFFVILRERFLIWQGIRSVIIVLLTISLSSLPLGQFLSGEGYARQVMINILFDAAIAVSGPFLRSFVEPGMLSPRMHKLLGWKVLLVALSTPAMLMADCPSAYMMFRNLVLVSVLILLCAALAQAIWRGSRAAKFQAAAWFCLLLVCGISLFHDVFLGRLFPYFLLSLFAALALEMLLTSIGIGDRFTRMKEQHDRAHASAAAFEVMSRTDPLTGIDNRRSLEARFEAARPIAIAIADLDHFKRINDQFGHDVGDKVIISAARALASGSAFAARLGGEEFAVLFYSTRPAEEAERLRRRISQYIAKDVEGLDAPVTASMGFAILGQETSFFGAMKLADISLYEAKANGRNRIIKSGCKRTGKVPLAA